MLNIFNDKVQNLILFLTVSYKVAFGVQPFK